jgi:hypothetical protein
MSGRNGEQFNRKDVPQNLEEMAGERGLKVGNNISGIPSRSAKL